MERCRYNDADSNDRAVLVANVCRQGSFCVQHILIFLFTIGLTGKYLMYLDQYEVFKRAGIVLWFAYLAAAIETLFLHTLPHIWSEYYHSSPHFDCWNLRPIVKHFLLRLVFLVVLYGIEFLIAWLLLKDVLFGVSSIRFLSNWCIRFVCLLVIATHVAVFEPRESSPSSADEQSTVLMDDNDDESEIFSGTSPVRMDGEHTTSTNASSSLSPTESMPLIYFENMRERISSQLGRRSSESSSPYFVNVRSEATRIGIAFEVLLITIAACVLRNGMPMAWTRPFTACWALLVTAVAWLLLLFMLRRRGSEHPALISTSLTPFAKKHQYISIDV